MVATSSRTSEFVAFIDAKCDAFVTNLFALNRIEQCRRDANIILDLIQAILDIQSVGWCGGRCRYRC